MMLGTVNPEDDTRHGKSNRYRETMFGKMNTDNALGMVDLGDDTRYGMILGGK
jgi:hypothetical protein